MTGTSRQSVAAVDRLAAVDLAEVVAAFGHLLHAAGVPVTPERSGRLAAALALARPHTTEEVYWAGRVTLLSDHDQIEAYDRVFGQVFRGRADVADWRGQAPSAVAAADQPPTAPAPSPPSADAGVRRRPRSPALDATAPRPPPPPAGRPASATTDPTDLLAAASAEERLRHTDLAELTPDELATLRRLLADLPWATPRRTTRRAVRHPRGRSVDLRATLRRARTTAGDPVRRSYRHPTDRPRRLVLIADVSGSMEPYARAYLQLLHGAVRAARAEAFVFATRLTRLTRALAASDPDLALRRASASTPDWSGGTRIGAALAAFLDDHGRRGLARGAVVMIVSDGWDTGDPAAVGEQMARLARLAHRIVWVNPRRADPAYRPLVAGMAAALPHVDTFVSGHSVAALDEVVAAIRDPSR
jgi:uncharacterized protein with von Willebrand factor type A (vWA) domain